MQEVNSGKETDKGHLVVFLFSKKLKHEYDSDLRSNEHYLSSSENEAWKNISACTGFELMTSAISVLCWECT